MSLCKSQPQSMHGTAPSSKAEPHAGHLEGAAAGKVAAAFWAAAGRAPLPESGCAGGFDATPAAAATGVGASIDLPHEGQRTVLPATLSGTCIDLAQYGQRMTCGISPFVSAFRKIARRYDPSGFRHRNEARRGHRRARR